MIATNRLLFGVGILSAALAVAFIETKRHVRRRHGAAGNKELHQWEGEGGNLPETAPASVASSTPPDSPHQ